MKWSPQDLNIIVTFWKHYTYAHIGLMVNRSAYAVRQKANSLGLVKRKSTKGTWSQHQINTLINGYNTPGISVNRISKSVGKTIKQCYNKAARLGLVKTSMNGQPQKGWAVKLPNKKK